MEKIFGDILTWPWFSQPHGYNFNGLMVSDPAGNLCIDPVEPTIEVMDALVASRVSRILITNRNHVRAANRIRERTGARTYIHAADLDHAKSQGGIIDGELKVGEMAGPLKIVAVNGKSPGEVAFHWTARRILIVGDAMIGNPPGHLNLLPERVIDDPARLRQSIRGLLALDFDTVLVGDGVSVFGDGKERVKELIESFPK